MDLTPGPRARRVACPLPPSASLAAAAATRASGAFRGFTIQSGGILPIERAISPREMVISS